MVYPIRDIIYSSFQDAINKMFTKTLFENHPALCIAFVCNNLHNSHLYSLKDNKCYYKGKYIGYFKFDEKGGTILCTLKKPIEFINFNLVVTKDSTLCSPSASTNDAKNCK